MNKETSLIFVRALMTALGSWLIGNYFMGSQLTPELWQIILGIILSGVSVFWSVKEKTVNEEIVNSFVRQVVSFFGGLMVASGKITPERLDSLTGLILVIVPIILSYFEKKKSTRLANRQITISKLKTLKPDKAA